MNSEVYGIVKIDEQNRITLPEGARAAYDIQPGERLVVMRNEADELVLVKAELFSEE
ncbi:MAG: AbrB/MazE/SpoVT family DNA-binding domain-containing protein [Lachnospiraceae bacterium]|jgi:AbrB family looped-hinge helix DNA binding protein|nr:AbrB/MazE/SpoVT family DNA-binding domain-containing protein [Lachnospiraceae bacterium]